MFILCESSVACLYYVRVFCMFILYESSVVCLFYVRLFLYVYFMWE